MTRSSELEVVGPTKLVVQARDHIRQVMEQQRDRLYEVRVTYIVHDRDPTADRPRVAMLSRKDIQDWRARLKRDPEITILSSPRMTIRAGEMANASILNQTAYVKDFDVQIVNAAMIADPVIDVIQDGIVTEVACIPDPDGTIHVHASIVASVLERPIAEFERTLAAGGAPVTIQLPEITYFKWKSDGIVLTADESAFCVTGLAYPADNKDGKRRLLETVFEIRVVELPVPVGGRVVGVDTTSKLAFVRITRPRELGESVAFWRAGQSVAKGTIEQVMGEVVTVRYGDTAPKKGDEVR